MGEVPKEQRGKRSLYVAEKPEPIKGVITNEFVFIHRSSRKWQKGN